MIVKLCPFCDSEMKKAHYCDACGSFVWKPQKMDIHYNTEARGLGEVDCSYGEVHDARDHHIPKDNITKNKGGAGKLVFRIILLIIIMNLVITAIITIAGVGLFRKIPSGISELEELLNDEEEEVSGGLEYIEIEDDELASYPDGCTNADHFDVSIDAVRPAFEQWVSDFASSHDSDPDDIYTWESADNYRYQFQGEWYITLDAYCGYEPENEDDTIFTAGYDSATGKLHFIGADNLVLEDVREFTVFAASLIGAKGIETEAAIDEELQELNSSDSCEYDGEDFSFYIYDSETTDENGDTLYLVQIHP